MKAFLGIGVLVQVGSVEVAQAMLIRREVGWDPVKDDADPFAVQVVHEVHEILGPAVAAGGGEVAARLVTPRAVKWMFHDRQKLHMREPGLPHIAGELGCDFPVPHPAVPLLGNAHPRAQVQFVNGNRTVQGVVVLPVLHPRLVAPPVVEVPDHRAGSWRDLGRESEGICLVDTVILFPGDDMVFVVDSFAHPWNEALPYPGIPPRSQGMVRFVPSVKVSHQKYLLRVRREYSEIGAQGSLQRDRVRAQLFVQSQVAPLVEEVEVLFRQQADLADRGFVYAHGPLNQ